MVSDPVSWTTWRDFKHRRQRRMLGASEQDAWNGDEYIAWRIAATAEQLRKEPVGHPVGLSIFGWNEVLRYIQEGFEAWLALHDPLTDDSKHGRLYEKYKKGMDHFARFHPDMWS